MCAIVILSKELFHSLLTGFGLIYERHKRSRTYKIKSLSLSAASYAQKEQQSCLHVLLRTLFRASPAGKRKALCYCCVITALYTMPRNSWRLQPEQLLGVAHTDDGWAHTRPLPGSIPVAPPPTTTAAAHSDDNKKCRFVSCAFDGCLRERRWISEERDCGALPFLTIPSQISRINCDLLTRTRKQVDGPAGGRESFHCCGWNV